jgi:pyruvate dehydrogenase E2 component (dihydrolipoamide acetyltransferase)
MKSTVKMPKVADSVNEVFISEFMVSKGSEVNAGDPLMLVETDKASVEVPSPVSGTVIAILVSIDEEVSTGAPIVEIEVP